MRFLLVDDHSLIVQAMSLLLSTKFPGSDIHTGSSAEQARMLVREYGDDADLLILDLNLPDSPTPTGLLEELTREGLSLKILVLSGIVDPASIEKVLSLGAAGFVPKSLDPKTLTEAIDFVLAGGVYVPTGLLGSVPRAGVFRHIVHRTEVEPSVHLTARQQDVLMALARGLSIKRICRELDLSEGTVKTHVSAIYRAFGARNRTEALIAARHAGFEINI